MAMFWLPDGWILFYYYYYPMDESCSIIIIIIMIMIVINVICFQLDKRTPWWLGF